MQRKRQKQNICDAKKKKMKIPKRVKMIIKDIFFAITEIQNDRKHQHILGPQQCIREIRSFRNANWEIKRVILPQGFQNPVLFNQFNQIKLFE